MKCFNTVSIHGVPRSGTSWLGQIFNSHPDVAYRFQPLFSYQFKNRIDLNSTREDVKGFLKDLYQIKDDDFIFGKWRDKYNPIDLDFHKNAVPGFLVMKMVRYHHLLEKLLDSDEDLKVVGIVRNPCAVVNSWINTPKEFNQNWEVMAEWRYARKKNLGKIEEYNGFEKWKELAYTFLELEKNHPERFFLLQYENLVEDPYMNIEDTFSFVGLKIEPQVDNFIKLSQVHHSNDAYTVFKLNNVKDKWRKELDPRIAETIKCEIKGTELERFLI